MPNPFSWDYLNTVPPSNDVIDGWSILLLIVFGAGFIVSSLLFYRPGIPPFRGKFRRKAVQFGAGTGMWIFGFGLFFFLIQLLQIDPFTFGRRIWMFLTFVVSICFLVAVAARYWQKVEELKATPVAPNSAIRTGPPHRRPVRRRRI
jgi:hypothetical protein